MRKELLYGTIGKKIIYCPGEKISFTGNTEYFVPREEKNDKLHSEIFSLCSEKVLDYSEEQLLGILKNIRKLLCGSIRYSCFPGYTPYTHCPDLLCEKYAKLCGFLEKKQYYPAISEISALFTCVDVYFFRSVCYAIVEILDYYKIGDDRMDNKMEQVPVNAEKVWGCSIWYEAKALYRNTLRNILKRDSYIYLSTNEKIPYLLLFARLLKQSIKYDQISILLYSDSYERNVGFGVKPLPLNKINESEGKRELSFEQDNIISFPFKGSRLSSVIPSIIKNDFPENTDNHRGIYYPSLNIGFAQNGYHSTAAGIVWDKGTVHFNVADDKKLLTDYYSDGEYWYKKNYPDFKERVIDFRLAVLLRIYQEIENIRKI